VRMLLRGKDFLHYFQIQKVVYSNLNKVIILLKTYILLNQFAVVVPMIIDLVFSIANT